MDAGRASETDTDSEAQLASMLADNDVDGTDWIAVEPIPDALASTLWANARAAADRCDAATLRQHLAEARLLYSPAGWRMLRSGVLNLLAIKVAGQQEEQPDPLRPTWPNPEPGSHSR